MVASCYICKKRHRKGSGVSFHAFPKAPESRRVWEGACKLEQPVPKGARICSEHFRENDFIPHREYGLRLLKPSTIPSIFAWTEEANLTTKNDIANENFTHMEVKPSMPTCKMEGNEDCIPVGVSFSCEGIMSHDKENNSSNTSSTRDVSVQCNLHLSEPPAAQQLKKTKASGMPIKVWRPARIGDLTPEHFSTPRCAARNLELVKRKVNQNSSKITCLQHQNRRLLKQISSLQNLITHLKRRNFTSKNAVHGLMEASDPLSDLIAARLQQKKKCFTQELKKFAITLHFLLLHPRTIRKWFQVLDGSPGFTAETFRAIAHKAAQELVICNLMIDEMSIRRHIQ